MRAGMKKWPDKCLGCGTVLPSGKSCKTPACVAKQKAFEAERKLEWARWAQGTKKAL